MPNQTPGRTPARPAGASDRGRTRPPVLRADHASPSIEVPGPERPPAAPVRLWVKAADPSEHLFRHLLSGYLGGARSFEVVERPHLSARTREVVREFCRRTHRPEIVRDTGTVLELVDRDRCDDGSLDDRLGQLGDRVVAFHREAVESWAHLPFGDERRWERRDDDVDRDAWYLERCIALGEGGRAGPSRPATGAWTIARSLERIADHAVTLGEVGPRLTVPGVDAGRLRELRQFHRQAMEHLEQVLRTPDGSRANDLLDVGEALLAGGQALSERLLPSVVDGSMSPASAAAVARALEAIARTVAYSQDIAQAFIDRALLPASPPPRVPAPTMAGAPVG